MRSSTRSLGGRLIATLQSDWHGNPAGSIIAYSIPDVLAGKPPAIERVLAPTKAQAVEQVASSKSLLWVKMLDDVSGRLVSLARRDDGNWTQTPVALPGSSTVHLDATGDLDDQAFATVEGFLTPPALYAIRPGATPGVIDRLPARFDATKMTVEQRFATSKDGTRIPYFLVRKRGADSPVPALIHAYGGFRLAQTPTYLVDQPYRSGPAGLFWVEEGNAFVLANIRGGGEYGPRWHEATMREKHQNAFDDLAAVAEDPCSNRRFAKGTYRHLRPLERRSPHRRIDRAASRSLRRGDHRLSADRHEALFAFAPGRILDRRIWRPGQTR